MISHSPQKCPAGKNGSALLITLLVVSLLLVVVLSFVAVIRLELRNVLAHQETLQARSHARLALNLAVAQLQVTAGPDQRSTARADIGTFGDGNPVTPDNGIPAPLAGARPWTGVWGNAANPMNETAPGDFSKASLEPEVPVLLSWLVSGNETAWIDSSRQTADFGRITAHPDAAGASAVAGVAPWVSPVPANSGELSFRPDQSLNSVPNVTLVGPGTAGEGADAELRFVRAPLVDIRVPEGPEPAGRYAWWVGDEGLKAHVSLQPDGDTLSGSAARVRDMQRPGRMNIAFRRPAWDADWAGLERLVSDGQLAHAPDGDTPARLESFHEYTLHSLGLLSDSAKGGLKKDLSAVLSGAAPSAEYADEEALFTLPAAQAPSSLSIENRGSLTQVQWSGDMPAPGTLPNWGALRGFAGLQDSISGDIPTVSVQAPSDSATPHEPGIFPIATRVHFHVHAAIVNGQAYVIYLPSVVLWNPYNVRLAPAEYWFNIEINYFSLPSDYANDFDRAFPAVMVVHGPVLDEAPYFSNTNTMWQTTQYRENHMVAAKGASQLIQASERMNSAPGQGFRFIVRCVEPLEPGEARVFSPLEAEELSADPTQRVLVDGFSENTWFHERISLDQSIGDNHVFRFIVSWPSAALNRPSRYTYGLGTGFSEPTTLRRMDGATAPGAMNTGNLAGTLRRDLNTTSNTDLISGASNFPHNDSNRANGRVIASWLSSLDPDSPGGQVPPDFRPLGWDYKIQMAFPGRQGGESSGYPDVHIKWLGQHNPLSYNLGASLTDAQGGRGYNTNPYFPMNALSAGGLKKRIFDQSPDFPDSEGATFVGGSHFLTVPATPGRLVLRDLPRRETGLLSIGALQHAEVHPRRGQLTPDRSYTATAMPAFAIGNALADPRLHPGDIDGFPNNWNSTMSYGGNNFNNPRSDAIHRRLHFDLSYLLNRALWDRFYFSSVPRSGSLTDANGRLIPLPNPHLRAAGTLADPQELRDVDRAAENLMLQGAFNINSTSVDAWAALLASFRGLNPPGSNLPADLTPYSKLPRPLADPLQNSGGGDLTFVANRFRTLTDGEIRLLAESLVEEIRARGPVLSLAAFVNRRPQALASASPAAAAAMGRTHGDYHSSNPLERRVGQQALLGTLQLAMDRVVAPSATQPGSVTGINDRLRTFLDARDGTTSSNNGSIENQPILHRMAAFGFRDSGQTSIPSAVETDAPLAVRSSAVGMPGYLTQADLLQSIGPMLSARSDTFRVRVHGEVPSGARAVAEAIVQRRADYVDPADDPVLHPSQTLPVNQRFGRRFHVVSFRWLNPEEI